MPPLTVRAEQTPDPYRGVVALLLVASLLGIVVGIAAGVRLNNIVLLDTAVSFTIAAGILIGVLVAQVMRERRRATGAAPEQPIALATELSPEPTDVGAEERRAEDAADRLFDVVLPPRITGLQARYGALQARVDQWYETLDTPGKIRLGTAVAGIAITIMGFPGTTRIGAFVPIAGAVVAALCLAGAGLIALVTRYLAELDQTRLPEAAGLTRGARVLAWILVLAALSIGFQWQLQFTLVGVVHLLVVVIDLATCVSLLVAPTPHSELPVFQVDLGPFAVLGSRPNILRSLLDAAEQKLGIDLRSTWALTVVRRGLEPLAIGLILLGWMSTSLTVIGIEEQGLVERFGVVVAGAPLEPGLHTHLPWPIDHVLRLPVRRVQAIGVGHEGEEAPGPENVLWAVQHAPNEFTLLLGNGRDLITIDAAVQYRIADAHAWRYHCQNPQEALKVLAYRAVMRNTVNHTLSETLSENVALLTERMRAMVQHDADALGLGVEVVGFTVGGMHPPVAVAASYEAVVSAQIRKVTAVVNAQVFRNTTLPAAEDSVLVRTSAARQEAAENLARAAGEAWSFRALEAQYHAAPADYLFRRRLETLEKNLAGRGFTVVDARFLRDGGELWITP